jgi:hypothetical protein
VNAIHESVETCDGVKSNTSPETTAATDSTTPPQNIWIAVESRPLDGSGSRGDKNDPSAHENDANSTRKNPSVRLLPPPPPGASRSPTPMKPTKTLISVATAILSPVIRRISTTHSGTAATTSAAKPESMCTSATFTMPLPPAASSVPATKHATSSRRVTHRGAPRSRAIA